ncbi:MAG: CRISPR-associated helicase Cas3' [Deltaproteobacteria bacterium]|nr:CRISPR-associated helicase Cas3' [Deltaproteobacteria bacterium]MCL5277563.1 CRISPR-associated helicase Cas3' [Deltaproteobacteria bacterium]
MPAPDEKTVSQISPKGLANYIAHRREKDGEIQSLGDHLKEVSKITGEFASKIGLKEQGELIGFLHDIGKASQEFKQYIKSAVGLINPDEDEYVDAVGLKGKVDHSTAGAHIVYRNLSKNGAENLLASQVLSLCIASHHSGMIDCLSPDGEDNFTRRMNKPEEKTHTDEALSSLDPVEERKLTSSFSNDMGKHLVGGLMALKEKNDSKETLALKWGLLTRFLFSCLIDADRLSTADFEFPGNKKIRNVNKYPAWKDLIERFDAVKFENKNKVDILRNRVSLECLGFAKKPKGLYQLTVPTGGGKTFASLRFALNHIMHHKMDRIFYIIPYTSIIDQNAEEVRKILEDKDQNGKYLNEVVLEHHSNLTPDKETKRQNLLSENWNAPIVFTTQVQFLEAFFSSGTRGARRMHQFANAVIIFDEVQTIPVRCVHLFNLAIRFLVKGCGSTVILCTATQPLLDKIEPPQRSLTILPEQQMIKDVKMLFSDLRRVVVHDRRKPGGWRENEVVDLAGKEIQKSNNVLIVVNTKSSAQNLLQQLKKKKTAKVYHLSTNMCPAHRMKVLDEIKGRLEDKIPKPTICVSTQLIEAGVDIDFGAVIRYLAGLDSIAQAAGRCNRHGRRPSGNVYIVNPQNENLSRLEDIKIGSDVAERVLDEFKKNPVRFNNDILSPSTMNQYYVYYFYLKQNKMNYPVSSKSIVGREDNLFDLLSTNVKSLQEYKRIHDGVSSSLFLNQSFQSASKVFRAIDSSTRGIIVPYGKEGKQRIIDLCAAYDLEKQYCLLKSAQRYSVNVFAQTFEKLIKQGAIHEVKEGTGVYYLDPRYYSDEIGLTKEIINEPEPQIFKGGVYG